MTYIIIKRGRYLTGHSYATGIGYRFSWSANAADARRIDPDSGLAVDYPQLTGGKLVEVPSTRRELQTIYKRRSNSPHWQWAAPRYCL